MAPAQQQLTAAARGRGTLVVERGEGEGGQEELPLHAYVRTYGTYVRTLSLSLSLSVAFAVQA